MPALGDFENTILTLLQQPGANFGVGQYPNWALLTNPQYGQGLLDYFINQGYRRVASDLADYNLMSATFTLSSSTNVGSYPIPPVQGTNPFPEIRLLKEVYYLPIGHTQSMRMEPGSQLVSWTHFQQITGQTYLRVNTGSTWPAYCSIGSQRNTLEFFPTPLSNGDVITVYYAPLPTANAMQYPLLVNQTDVPGLPSDAHDAIVYWALWFLYKRNGDDNNAESYRKLYGEEIARLKVLYARDSAGDSMQFNDTPTYAPVEGMGWARL